MSKLVLIDSQIFIWGIKEKSSPCQDHMIPPAKIFVKHLEDSGYRILMPVPQLGELLSAVPVDEQKSIRDLIDKRFVVVPFDDLAAAKFGELVYKSLHDEDLKKYREEHKVTKNKLKFDCMLVAIAITRQASKIYSNDSDLLKYAQNQIKVEDMPIFPKQVTLFG